ncbi:MAG TPA: peptidase E [Longimicrobium sp.]|nr:peptidase E [Longimicrobium sp.]
MPPFTQGQIVVFGGGGFAVEPQNRLLDEYVLRITGRRHPRVCFLPTASGDAQAWIDAFYAAFPEEACEPTHLSLFSRRVDDLLAFLLKQDLVYVGGGNTVNLLAVWRAQGLADVLDAALAEGVVFAGVSAGALCWFERGITDSYGPGLNPMEIGLGVLEGAFCPHYDSDPRRPESYRRYIAAAGAPGWAVDDGVALHYVDGRLERLVSSRPDARAYRYTPAAGGEVEVETVEPIYLGGRE